MAARRGDGQLVKQEKRLNFEPLTHCVCREYNISKMADRFIIVDGITHTDNFCGPVGQQPIYLDAQTLDGGSPTPGVEDMRHEQFDRTCGCGETTVPSGSDRFEGTQTMHRLAPHPCYQMEHEEFAGGGMREAVGDRPRFELLWPKDVPYDEQLLTRFARHMARGAIKYQDRNWESFSDQAALDRAESSLLRHVYQWLAGDTAEDHAAAILFNVMAAEHVKRKLES